MGRIQWWTIAVFCAMGVLGRWHEHFTLPPPRTENTPQHLITGIFQNRKDHFNLSSNETYSQRYWSIDDYWDSKNGPMILYVSGEAPARVIALDSMPFVLAKELKAKVYILEHRFYGISQPTKDWSLDSLHLLTHQQALADIANFILSENANTPQPSRRWLLIGGSYAGALVAWFKIKYPHLAFAAYSSSGVVNAIVDYYMYMEQVKIDLAREPECLQSVSELSVYATNIITKGTEAEKLALKTAMNATMLDDIGFLYYFHTFYLGLIQYGKRKLLCPTLIKIGREPIMSKRIELLAVYAKSINADPQEYTNEALKKTQLNFESMDRQWMYQICSSLGYFQTGRKNPVIPDLINVDYYKTMCKDVFGVALEPEGRYTNAMTGDLRVVKAVDYLLFVNGGDDPWQWASVRNENLSDDTLLVLRIQCDDCAHCVDLHSARPDSPSSLLVFSHPFVVSTPE